jgi:hypothetical protein
MYIKSKYEGESLEWNMGEGCRDADARWEKQWLYFSDNLY